MIVLAGFYLETTATPLRRSDAVTANETASTAEPEVRDDASEDGTGGTRHCDHQPPSADPPAAAGPTNRLAAHEDRPPTVPCPDGVSMQATLLESVRSGAPSLTSVLAAVDHIYEELYNRLYQQAPAVLLVDEKWAVLEAFENRLRLGLCRWRDGTSLPGGCRRQARELLPKDLFPFVDLLDFQGREFYQRDYRPEVRLVCSPANLDIRELVGELGDGNSRRPVVSWPP